MERLSKRVSPHGEHRERTAGDRRVPRQRGQAGNNTDLPCGRPASDEQGVPNRAGQDRQGLLPQLPSGQREFKEPCLTAPWRRSQIVRLQLRGYLREGHGGVAQLLGHLAQGRAFHGQIEEVAQEHSLCRRSQLLPRWLMQPRLTLFQVDGKEGKEDLTTRNDERHALAHEPVPDVGRHDVEAQGDFEPERVLEQANVVVVLGRRRGLDSFIFERDDQAGAEQLRAGQLVGGSEEDGHTRNLAPSQCAQLRRLPDHFANVPCDVLLRAQR